MASQAPNQPTTSLLHRGTHLTKAIGYSALASAIVYQGTMQTIENVVKPAALPSGRALSIIQSIIF